MPISRSRCAVAVAVGLLALAAPSLAQRTRVAAGTLNGVVRQVNGQPISGAQIQIDLTTVLSGTDGGFQIGYPNRRAFVVRVRKIGFLPAEIRIAETGPPDLLEVSLRPVTQQLPAVVVRADSAATSAHLREFDRRLRSGQGTYLTADDIRLRGAGNAVDLFRNVPGVDVDTRGVGQTMIRFRGQSCDPLVWIDGYMLAAGFFDPASINPDDVVGVEIYRGVATVPPELRGAGGKGTCGVIAIWTRRLEDPRRAMSERAVREAYERERSLTVYGVDEVDIPAAPLEGKSLRPDFPDSLLRAGSTGEVIVEFVIDTLGVPVPGTAVILASTHPALSGAALAAVPPVRYTPAMKGGVKVRQLVQVPILFRIAPASPPPASPIPPPA